MSDPTSDPLASASVPDHGMEQAVQPDGSHQVIHPTPAATDPEPMPLGVEQIQPTRHAVHRMTPPAAEHTAQPPESVVERSTALIDHEFAINLGRPWIGFVFTCMVMAAMAVASVLTVGMWGLLYALGYGGLLALAVALFFRCPRKRRLCFTADGISMTRPDERLEYQRIVEVYAPDQTRRGAGNFAIHLLHATGYVTIPPSVLADSRALVDFLETQPLGKHAIPQVAPVLRDFLKQQVTVHGSPNVYVYHASQVLPPAQRARPSVWANAVFVAIGLIVLGLGLFALGITMHAEAAITFGIIVVVLGGMFVLLLAVQKGSWWPGDQELATGDAHHWA